MKKATLALACGETFEGFACGVPVVGSDSGEIPHVLGDAGLVVGEADRAAWQRTLTEVLESPARRRELAARGLHRARDRFAWPVIARQHLDFFEEVLAGRKARPRGLREEGFATETEEDHGSDQNAAVHFPLLRGGGQPLPGARDGPGG